MKKQTKTELFLQLANPDENGVSRWVSVSEFVENYKDLKLGNGGSWCRASSTLAKKYIISYNMQKIDLDLLQNNLRKRLDFPYRWGRKQADDWDRKTNFIYEIRSFSQLLKEKVKDFDDLLRDYTFNRWLNFWSAKGIEQIFAENSRVTPNVNEYDKLKDFEIDNIPFDHKTSVFPKGFNKELEYALNNKRELIEWFYREQSQQGRKHYKNRIFVVLYDKNNGEHWKLKAEIKFIEEKIHNYLKTFSLDKLEKFNFEGEEVYSDIIWVIN